ncbi:unnamed protein product [Cladocopium goreaui]|uniref:EF-hand domain-containing protein n=1 Tax=Cladocopium goreaui TaxID=2562237 RepID=A0A9P1FDS7_9DINO|nr:unnamed protein product [Cladocopium goreaui]
MHAAASALRSRLSSRSEKQVRGEERIPLSSEDVERQQLLLNDVMISEGLTKFAKDFVRSVSTHLELVDHLLAVLRAMEPTFEFEASVQAQVWALASGVKATAPRVAVEMKKHLARLQELRTSTHKVMELFERKRSAMVEKNHYTLKVETLRREFQEREEQRKGNSKDQLHRLSRNQEKLAYAESEYMDTDKVVTKKIEEQLRQNRSLLFSSLEGLAQSACCGWLVSTGAVACKALQVAAEAQAPQSEGSEDRPERSAVPRNMLLLPPVVVEDELEPPGPFDPRSAFKEKPHSREIFDLSDGEAMAITARQVDESLMRCSVKELKELIRKHGLSDDGLVEKSELVELLRRHGVKVPPGPGPAGHAMLEFERLERHPPAMHRGHAPFPHPNLQEMERGDFAGMEMVIS